VSSTRARGIFIAIHSKFSPEREERGSKILYGNLREEIIARNFQKTHRVKPAWNAVVRESEKRPVMISEILADLSQKISSRKKKATNSSRVVADEEVQCPSE
jgi:hypothetical protein